jgi:hypothetical protein
MAAHVARLTVPVLVGVGAAFDIHAGRLHAGTQLDADLRARVALPSLPGTATALAALPAQQPEVHSGHPLATTA